MLEKLKKSLNELTVTTVGYAKHVPNDNNDEETNTYNLHYRLGC